MRAVEVKAEGRTNKIMVQCLEYADNVIIIGRNTNLVFVTLGECEEAARKAGIIIN